jgi:hypothetical protein
VVTDLNDVVTDLGGLVRGRCLCHRGVHIILVSDALGEGPAWGGTGVGFRLRLDTAAERVITACSVGTVVGLEVCPDSEVGDVTEDSLDQPAEAQIEDPTII